jgi:hypothetical protein
MADDALIEENLDDELEDLGKFEDWSQGAVLWSTDWTAETILGQQNKNNIDLDPSFQRRSAWTDKKQSLFIESLILGLPIPQFILADNPKKRGAFIVIDGKQRLLAIRRFGASDPDGGFKPLKLRGLTKLDHLNGKTYADLQDNDDFAEDLAAFENSSIRTIVIRNVKKEEYLYEVFLRINTGSVQLSPQELRQALHPGKFSTFVGEASADSAELKLALNLTEPDFRMRDAEILLRFLAYRYFISEYNGNLKDFLDKTTFRLNEAWNKNHQDIKNKVVEMENALAFTRAVFTKGNYLRKWNGNNFETKKNRAVFDIMLHYFSVPEVRDGLAGKEAAVVEAFKDLCNIDEFRVSLETTTKSIESNKTRFNYWAKAIEELSDFNLDGMKFPERKEDANT